MNRIVHRYIRRLLKIKELSIIPIFLDCDIIVINRNSINHDYSPKHMFFSASSYFD